MTSLHVAIIMDGNGRWAKKHGKPRWRGHLAGVESVRDVVRSSPDLGVSTLTLYTFSSDNWQRPPTEVGRIFWLLREYCVVEREELLKNGARVTAIGRRDRIPKSALWELEETERVTAQCTRLNLRLAIDYSAKWSIATAVREVVKRARTNGNFNPDAISAAELDNEIARGVPHPDLLIRTAGERRLSDFLLWELAYAELYFTPVLWPDFRGEHLQAALEEFQKRERRYGALPAEKYVEPDEIPEAANALTRH